MGIQDTYTYLERRTQQEIDTEENTLVGGLLNQMWITQTNSPWSLQGSHRDPFFLESGS